MANSIDPKPSIGNGRLGDWERTLGRFIINFGMIEYLVEVFLKDHLETIEYEKVRGWHLNDRAVRIATHLAETGSPSERQEEFALLVRKLDQFREFRNHIAHGHLTFRMIPGTETFVVCISNPRHLDQEYSPNAKHVEFDELRSRLTDLTELVEAFKRFAGFKPYRSDSLTAAFHLRTGAIPCGHTLDTPTEPGP